MFLGSSASAQEGSFPAERLRPAMDRDGILDTEWGRVPDHLNYDVALWMGYALNPLVVSKTINGITTREGALVAHRVGANLVGAISLFDWVEIGLDVPVVLFQARDLPDPGQIGPAVASSVDAIGIGDLRLSPKVRILRSDQHFVDLAVLPTVTVPSNFPRNAYMGEQNFTFAPELALSRALGPVRLAANLGYRMRAPSDVGDLAVGWEIFYRGAVAYGLKDSTELPLELAASVSGSSPSLPPFALNQNPLEVLGGLSYDVMDRLQVFGGAGVGIIAGYGTPDARVVAGVRYSPRTTDRDGDGLEDADDACPTEPEDADDFQDADGCPDPDNDRDGVADVSDDCPLEPEDGDSFQDSDGCPDPDNDGDGILDGDDECRDEAGVPEKQGCPVRDRDGDTVEDDLDECPDEPGLVARNGCPAPDRDGDGVPDDDDACPDTAGVVELAGCPDGDGDGIADDDDVCPEEAGEKRFSGCPDADGDGIPSPLDQCPDEAEVINGIDDEDGCPDKGETKVVVTSSKIEILEKVFFATGSARIRRKSFNLLDQVASVLKTNPQITKVRVEGHTDAQGNDKSNLKLSQRRAASVVKYLVKAGVAEEVLASEGFGETLPVADNDTREGREKNRRVEFIVVELDGEPVGGTDTVESE
jgi:outer membrane protein OmpA-like peptidoglycan-associated protein